MKSLRLIALLTAVLVLLATVACAAGPPTNQGICGITAMGSTQVAAPSRAAVPAIDAGGVVALKSTGAQGTAEDKSTGPMRTVAVAQDVGATQISRIATQAYIPDKWITVAYTFTRTTVEAAADTALDVGQTGRTATTTETVVKPAQKSTMPDIVVGFTHTPMPLAAGTLS